MQLDNLQHVGSESTILAKEWDKAQEKDFRLLVYLSVTKTILKSERLSDICMKKNVPFLIHTPHSHTV